MRGTEIEHAPTERAEDNNLKTFFKVPAEIHLEPHIHGKMHHSSRTVEAGDEDRERRKKRMDMEKAMRASLVDEEIL